MVTISISMFFFSMLFERNIITYKMFQFNQLPFIFCFPIQIVTAFAISFVFDVGNERRCFSDLTNLLTLRIIRFCVIMLEIIVFSFPHLRLTYVKKAWANSKAHQIFGSQITKMQQEIHYIVLRQ